jgi:hypothetical protein
LVRRPDRRLNAPPGYAIIRAMMVAMHAHPTMLPSSALGVCRGEGPGA